MSRALSADLLITRIVEAYNQKVFHPHLEADWVGHLYHLAVNELPDWEVHLSARVCGHSADEKFDFVVGHTLKALDGRPCVQPSLVAEIKCFVKGFTSQQNQVHLGQVLDRDLPKLHSLNRLKLELKKYLVLFDEVDYLQGGSRVTGGSKFDRVLKRRLELDKDIRILLVRPSDPKRKDHLAHFEF